MITRNSTFQERAQMLINHLMGEFVFLGGERTARAIYEHMKDKLTALEQYVLLHYLGLSIHDEARRAYRIADAFSCEVARQSVMARFPKEWPPSDRAA